MNFKRWKQNSNASVGLPVFFCENCGNEVSDDDDTCSRCGKRFAGVKCPRCFYEGGTDSFANGCPMCHFKTDKKEEILSTQQMSQHSLKVKKGVTSEKKRAKNSSDHRVLSEMTMVGTVLVALILVFFLYMCAS